MNSIAKKSSCSGCLVLLIFLFLPLFVYAEYAEAGPDPAKDAGQASVSQETADEAAPEEFGESKPIRDPLEPWNRFVFGFNDRLYFWLLKPVAQGYSFVVPEFGRVRVRNAFENITMPVRFVNSVLQLKMKGAGIELARFLINSTVGLGGMFDVASQNPKLAASDEDLGQTLGVYGIGEGFYLVWPVLGPSSLRDSVGLVGDGYLNPVSYITPFFWNVIAIDAYEQVNKTSLTIGEYEDLKESAVDPYASAKDAYTEYRRNKVRE